MAQSSQSTPTVAANIGGTNHQVNLRDYLNIRVAPFIKKAITESLDASPEFPLQWLGENLIHQSMLYEGNPDRSNIKERFLYKFDTPVAATTTTDATVDLQAQSQVDATPSNTSAEPSAITNGTALDHVVAEDTQMSNHVNGNEESVQSQPLNEVRDADMAGTSQE